VRLMRYMRWSYDQLMQCPESYLAVIGEEAKREADARREASRSRRHQ
jgi:hypothetical protein